MTGNVWWKGPVKAEPNFNNILKVLKHEKPDRPTLFEFFMNGPLYKLMAGPEAVARFDGKPYGGDIIQMLAFRNAGYDYSTVGIPNFSFPSGNREHKNTISQNQGFVITDRKSFDAYRWPDPEKVDFTVIDKVAEHMPKGMKLMVCGPCGVLENVTFLLGYENMCFMIADDEKLAGDVFEAVGSRLVRFYEKALQNKAVGFVIGNDDWGFKSQPMISPDSMRQFVVPWHKEIVRKAHAAGKPAVMHSCGNLTSLMNDIIDDIGYDGKHSYEDTIQPVESAYDQYGGRIAVMGGIDLDFLCRSTPEQVHDRAKALIKKTSSRGSYALGSGNSIPEYVPHDSYFAMIGAATAER